MPSAHPDMPERKFAYTWSRTLGGSLPRLHRKGWRSANWPRLPYRGRTRRRSLVLGDDRFSRGNAMGTVSGVANTRDEACQLVEDHYRRFAADRP